MFRIILVLFQKCQILWKEIDQLSFHFSLFFFSIFISFIYLFVFVPPFFVCFCFDLAPWVVGMFPLQIFTSNKQFHLSFIGRWACHTILYKTASMHHCLQGLSLSTDNFWSREVGSFFCGCSFSVTNIIFYFNKINIGDFYWKSHFPFYGMII